MNNQNVNNAKSNKLNEEIVATEKEIRDGEIIKIQAETMVATLREQYVKVDEELTSLNINPKKAEEDIANLNKEIEEKKTKLKSLIPSDIIAKYKNYNFKAQASSEVPNLGNTPF